MDRGALKSGSGGVHRGGNDSNGKSGDGEAKETIVRIIGDGHT